jgi:hypothetical protein
MAVLETPFPAILSGTINSIVTDPADPGTPQTIIERDDDWHVLANWSLTGPLAPFMAGKFTVKVFVEDIAATSFQGQIGATSVIDLNAAPVSQNRQYSADFLIPAASVPSGVYRLTTVLTYANLGVPLEMAGFVEGPLIQLYDKVFDNP